MTKINGDMPKYPKESGNGKVPLKKEEFYDISVFRSEEGTFETYKDKKGNMVKETFYLPDGRLREITEYRYDGKNRVISKETDYKNEAGDFFADGKPDQIVNTFYDVLGNPTEISDGDGW